MAFVLLPYMITLLLGKTIDLTTYDSPYYGQVFEGVQYDETPVHNFTTTYHVIQDDRFPYEFLNYPVDMGLLSKGRHLPRDTALSSLVKGVSWKYTSAVVVVKSIYRTVDRSLKQDAPQLKLSENVEYHVHQTETHYVNSLSYGGYAYIFYNMDCSNFADVEKVRKMVTKELGVEGVFTNEIAAKFGKLMNTITADKSLKGSVFNHPRIVSSVSSFLNFFSGTPSKLMENINRIPDQVGPLGVPMTMQLKPLHDIDDKFRTVKYHPEMISALEKVDEMYDDVQIAKDKFNELIDKYWENEDATKKMSHLLQHLEKSRSAFFLITYDVSLFKEMNNATLDKAFKLYQAGLEPGVSSYNLVYRRMAEELGGGNKI